MGILLERFAVGLDELESWVDEKANWLALGVIAATFFTYIFFARSCYLGADEALHFDAARPHSWLAAYHAAVQLAHPPLFIMFLHGMLLLGRSELVVRLTSILAGTAALWFTFAWIRGSLGKIPALAGLGFMALSPAAISAATLVRQYGLLVCFLCGALYVTERAFAERSTRWAIVQGLLLLCAVLTEYTAAFVLLSLGLYCGLRSLSDRPPWRLVLTMGTFQVAAAGTLVWFYLANTRRHNPFGPDGWLNYLQPYFYAPTRESPLGYTWRAIWGTFEFVSGRLVALPLMLLVLAGFIIWVIGRTKAPRTMALLVISPFVIGFVAALVRVVPFAGGRQQAYLLPFFAAGLSAAFAIVPRRMTAPLFLLIGFISPLWLMHTSPENDRRFVPLGDMTRAIESLNLHVPPGSPLFVDFRTRLVLGYYLTRNDASLESVLSGGFDSQLGRFRVELPRNSAWDFDSSKVLGQVNLLARMIGMRPGEAPWIVSVNSGRPPSLASQLPAGSDCDVQEFGLISVIHGRF